MPTGLLVVVSMVFDSGKNKDRTMMGISPEQAARELTDAGADVLGANCGQGIDGFASICARLRAASHLPIWLKPNAGLPKWINGKAEYSVLADDFAQNALDLAKAGGSFIGGCCGTSPDFIRAIHDRMNLLVVGGASRNQQ